MIAFLLKALLFILGLFLILLVLVQRGRGGGLAGALGGAGGQSAFGTKAGDVFTKITIGVAAVWILLCAAAVKMYRPAPDSNPFAGVQGGVVVPAPQAAGTAAAPTTGTAGTTTTGTTTSTGTTTTTSGGATTSTAAGATSSTTTNATTTTGAGS